MLALADVPSHFLNDRMGIGCANVVRFEYPVDHFASREFT
jgi:hypothetical protein